MEQAAAVDRQSRRPADLAGAGLMGDILFLAHRVPYPPDRGDKIRGFNIIKYLSARKRVHLIAFADDEQDLKRKGGLARYTGNRSIIWRSQGSGSPRGCRRCFRTGRPR